LETPTFPCRRRLSCIAQPCVVVGESILRQQRVNAWWGRGSEALRWVLCAGHFEVYLGKLFEEVSTAEANFFVETLGAKVPVHEAAGAMPLV
jgi:hypothetical protein